VHGAAIDVLGPVSDPRTIHQSKFSMGFVLAMIAITGSAGIDDFTEEALEDPALRRFSERVEMIFDPEIDAAYPQRWIGLVEIETTGGEHITSRVDVPKGDPENTLSREELEEKARNLAAFQGGASDAEMDRIIGRVWSLDLESEVRNLLPEV
jgi:2-methylcitrate dehydratase PrpD